MTEEQRQEAREQVQKAALGCVKGAENCANAIGASQHALNYAKAAEILFRQLAYGPLIEPQSSPYMPGFYPAMGAAEPPDYND